MKNAQRPRRRFEEETEQHIAGPPPVPTARRAPFDGLSSRCRSGLAKRRDNPLLYSEIASCEALEAVPQFELGVLVFNGTVPAAGDEPQFSAELGEVWLHTLPIFVGMRAQESKTTLPSIVAAAAAALSYQLPFVYSAMAMPPAARGPPADEERRRRLPRTAAAYITEIGNHLNSRRTTKVSVII